VCAGLFTELLPGNALIKSVTILKYTFSTEILFEEVDARTPCGRITPSPATMHVIFLYIILFLEVNRRGSNIHRGGWGLQLIERNKSTLSISAEHSLSSVQHQHIVPVKMLNLDEESKQ
jgi:hypothetical protein